MDDSKKASIFSALCMIPIAIKFTLEYILYSLLFFIVTAKIFFNGKTPK